MDVASEIIADLKKDKKFFGLFSDITTAKPGFINFHLGPKVLREELQQVLKKNEKYGSTKTGKGKKVNIEFVSANPTGPLTLGNGRSAAYGESLTRMFNFFGYRTTKEYFLNDLGRQVRLLGESVARKYLGLHGKMVDYPEEMYLIVNPILNEDYDFVIGSRMVGKREKGAMLPQALFGNWLASFLIRIFWGYKYKKF